MTALYLNRSSAIKGLTTSQYIFSKEKKKEKRKEKERHILQRGHAAPFPVMSKEKSRCGATCHFIFPFNGPSGDPSNLCYPAATHTKNLSPQINNKRGLPDEEKIAHIVKKKKAPNII